MNIKLTSRGFAVAHFNDIYGSSCSIQESSLAETSAIWLGVDIDFAGHRCTRMHLSQEQVRELMPILENFISKGDLRP